MRKKKEKAFDTITIITYYSCVNVDRRTASRFEEYIYIYDILLIVYTLTVLRRHIEQSENAFRKVEEEMAEHLIISGKTQIYQNSREFPTHIRTQPGQY